jgi:hypothetical protein
MIVDIAMPFLFLVSLVKSRIHARIRRNCNRISILRNDHVSMKVGFVRNIFALLALPAQPIAAPRHRVVIAHVA